MRIILIILLSFSLLSCASKGPLSLVQISRLEQGKSFFDQGYYKKAMRQLLPLACDGVPDAQYAVGYMYYYGMGVTQDTDVGYFWIKRAAEHRYVTAMKALESIDRNKNAITSQ